jgi:hypothetical protein
MPTSHTGCIKHQLDQPPDEQQEDHGQHQPHQDEVDGPPVLEIALACRVTLNPEERGQHAEHHGEESGSLWLGHNVVVVSWSYRAGPGQLVLAAGDANTNGALRSAPGCQEKLTVTLRKAHKAFAASWASRSSTRISNRAPSTNSTLIDNIESRGLPVATLIQPTMTGPMIAANFPNTL